MIKILKNIFKFIINIYACNTVKKKFKIYQIVDNIKLVIKLERLSVRTKNFFYSILLISN